MKNRREDKPLVIFVVSEKNWERWSLTGSSGEWERGREALARSNGSSSWQQGELKTRDPSDVAGSEKGDTTLLSLSFVAELSEFRRDEDRSSESSATHRIRKGVFEYLGKVQVRCSFALL